MSCSSTCRSRAGVTTAAARHVGVAIVDGSPGATPPDRPLGAPHPSPPPAHTPRCGSPAPIATARCGPAVAHLPRPSAVRVGDVERRVWSGRRDPPCESPPASSASALAQQRVRDRGTPGAPARWVSATASRSRTPRGDPWCRHRGGAGPATRPPRRARPRRAPPRRRASASTRVARGRRELGLGRVDLVGDSASVTGPGRRGTAAMTRARHPQERLGVAGERQVLLVEQDGATSRQRRERSPTASAISTATRPTAEPGLHLDRHDGRHRPALAAEQLGGPLGIAAPQRAPRCAGPLQVDRNGAGGSSASARSMSASARSHSPRANSGSTAFEARMTPELRSTPCRRARSSPPRRGARPRGSRRPG